jgi:hypothetical protein
VWSLVLALIVAQPALEAPPPAVTTTAPPVSAPPAPPPDPAADRVVLVPTAATRPAGTVFVASYDLFVWQVGWAITDRTQASITATPPVDGGVALLDVTIKTALVPRGPLRVAVFGAASGGAGGDLGVLFVGRAGATAQLCWTAACASTVAVATSVAFAGPVLAVISGAGGVWRVGRHMALLAELGTLVPAGREAGDINGAVASGGVRVPFTRWAFDLAVIAPLGRRGALPLLAATYR